MALDKLRLGVIGAGNYASTMLLPHLKTDPSVDFYAVATQSSLSAQNAARKFGFRHVTTNYQQILQDESVDAVVIATRHSSHARLAAEALRSGKLVYVEKPLAIDIDGLRLLWRAILESGNDRLMVGFNRRFAPLTQELARRSSSNAPTVVHYRVHAGQLEGSSWYLNADEGSRFVGEAGHFFDLMAFLTSARPLAVMATALRPTPTTADDLENIVTLVQYRDGSVGNLLYLTQGGASMPKERLELYAGGQTTVLDNFSSLACYGKDGMKEQRARLDKGQKQEMEILVKAARTGEPLPIPVEELFDTTLTTLAAVRSISSGERVDLGEYWKQLTAPSAAGARRASDVVV